MGRGSILVALGLASFLACGGHEVEAPKRSRDLTTCRVTLERDDGGATVPTTPTRSSRLVAHVELRLATLLKDLEATIPSRLADERNHGIGLGGHLNYTVDRGPFTASVENDALVVRTNVHARAEACRGRSCYASCAPEGRATATVPLRIGADYRFAPSRVAFAFTRGCSVKALGGILSVDVTPTLQGELAPTLRKVEHEIDAKLPPLRPQAARLWAELAKARPLPLGGCVLLHPRGLVQGPVTGNAETLRVRLGLVAEPEIQSRCSNAAAAKAGTAEAPPLPPLAQDPSLGPEDELVLALVSPLEQVDLSFREEGCHDATVRSSLAWGEGGKTFRLTAPTEALAGVRFQPPLPPDAIAELVPALAAGMSDAHLDVSAKITSVRPLDVTLRGDSASTEVAASVLVRGSVELKER